MLVALCFHDLFLYKILFHRTWVRFRSVSYLVFDVLFCFKLFSGAYVHIFSNFCAYLKGVKEKHSWGDNSCFVSVIFLLLSLGSCYLCSNLSLSFLFRFFLPRIASNRKKVRFGKVDVPKQISALCCKNS
jgi:hypothetical protein